MNSNVCCLRTNRLASDEKLLFAVVCSGYLNNTEFCYNMSHQRRGKLIIISNRYFLPESSMSGSPRHGTEYDVQSLRSTFTQLGFDCEVHEDKKSSEMLWIIFNGMQFPGNFSVF